MKKKINENQEIYIEESKFISIIEWTSLFLHIVAILLGVTTLIGLATDISEHAEHYLELFTIIIAIVIVLIHFLNPIIKRIYVRVYLNNFWGKSKIKSKIIRSDEIVTEGNYFGSITKTKVFEHEEIAEVNWDRSNIFKWKLYMDINIPRETTFISKDDVLEETKLSSKDYLQILLEIKTIQVDSKDKSLKMYCHIYSNDEPDRYRESFFTIYSKENIATWSGILPDHPYFGEWIWDHVDKIR